MVTGRVVAVVGGDGGGNVSVGDGVSVGSAVGVDEGV